MLYACLTCNSAKRDVWPICDPCSESYSRHLRINEDGTVDALTVHGKILVDTLKLGARHEFRKWFGFPDNLPDLRKMRVPSNRRPRGVNQSYYVLREVGTLPETY
jgi:hypothetical protein